MRQIQRVRRLTATWARSGIPSPPKHNGRQHLAQLQWQFPALASVRPDQRKLRRIFSTFFYTLRYSPKTVNW